MRDSLRDDIAALLARNPLPELPGAQPFNKAGILPFLPAASTQNWRVMLMRPVASKPELGPPPLQLCKGTRMAHIASAWRDMAEGEASDHAESLAATALREGVEELGLMLPLVLRLHDAGPFDFSSASTGRAKRVWMFAVEMESERLAGAVPTTAERAWLPAAEALRRIRADHRPILARMLQQLGA